MKSVFDTNVIISVFLSDGSPRKAFKRVLTGDVVLLISEAILHEFEGVISRKKFGFSGEEVMRMTELLQKAAYLVEPANRVNHINDDPSDNRILECAIAGGAEYIVTGDKHILNLVEFEGVKIVTASQFLEHLR